MGTCASYFMASCALQIAGLLSQPDERLAWDVIAVAGL